MDEMNLAYAKNKYLVPCVFCDYLQSKSVVIENKLAFAIFDTFPVNDGHTLVIPKRHITSYFDATQEEILAMNDLIHQVKHLLDDKYHPDGYNIGVNIGEDAGQTIFHLHVHVIPRYKNDVENPRGGVRNIKKALVEYHG